MKLRSAELERISSRMCVALNERQASIQEELLLFLEIIWMFMILLLYQYPADDLTAEWRTTHFDFHAIHDNVLKFDILRTR